MEDFSVVRTLKRADHSDLPVDAQELIALCVPRPEFISAGVKNVDGSRFDAKWMFLGAVHAGPVYTLLG